MARPEGKRVLVISAKGETVARQMSGAVTHRCNTCAAVSGLSLFLTHLLYAFCLNHAVRMLLSRASRAWHILRGLAF